MKHINMNKVIKIALGATLSILFAGAVGLANSASAGIITLLTIQDTKKETILISLKRVAAFIFAAFLGVILFNLLGFYTITYGIFLFLFVGGCFLFRLQDGIAMNAVLATHYLLAQNISVSMLINEAGLLLIGAGIGTLINFYMPSNHKLILEVQENIETDLRKVLFRMAYFLQEENKERYNEHLFDELDQSISMGLSEAYKHMNNTFFQESEYFIQYMEMRQHQWKVLKGVYHKILSLEYVPEQAYLVSVYIEKIANSLKQSNNAVHLLEVEMDLEKTLKESPLPATRQEFENRAILFMILKDMEQFLIIKKRFSDNLTQEQIEKYWS